MLVNVSNKKIVMIILMSSKITGNVPPLGEVATF
jgi:hypothetical protein